MTTQKKKEKKRFKAKVDKYVVLAEIEGKVYQVLLKKEYLPFLEAILLQSGEDKIQVTDSVPEIIHL